MAPHQSKNKSMANRIPSTQQGGSYRDQFILNGVDLLAGFGFLETAEDSRSMLERTSIDSSSDSDTDDNPFEPQPVKFMQTKEQKKRDAENLEKRKLLWTIRRMRERKQHHREITLPCGKMRRLKKHSFRRTMRQQKDPFKNLPAEIVLDLMRHTDRYDFDNLLTASPFAEDVYSENTNPCIKGIVGEQFKEITWLFGDSMHTSPEQKQYLKDWIGTTAAYSRNGEERADAVDRTYQRLSMIDNGNFTGPEFLACLQSMQDAADYDNECTWDNTGIELTRRAAVCIAALRMRRSEVVVFEDAHGLVSKSIRSHEMPIEDRISMFERQPATTQAEIRNILQRIVGEVARRSMDGRTARWLDDYYKQRPSDIRRSLDTMGSWLIKLAVGLVMQTVLNFWGEPIDNWESFSWNADEESGAMDFASLQALEMRSYAGGDRYFKSGLLFAENIGFDMGNVLPGTAVEQKLKELLEKETERLAKGTNEAPEIRGVYRVVDHRWTVL